MGSFSDVQVFEQLGNPVKKLERGDSSCNCPGLAYVAVTRGKSANVVRR